MSLELWILPGFLGKPADFSALVGELPEARVRAFDVTTFPKLPFRAWARHFLDAHKEDFAARDIHLFGYSLGGRLALHVADAAQDAGFGPAGYFFVSTNPGLPETDRAARRANDESWARRFEKEDWDQTLKEWNAQEVFRGGAREPARAEASYARDRLAWELREWSLANQESFYEKIPAWRAAQFWIAGARDEKFARIVENLRARGARGTLVKDASHRVHLDQPRLLSLAIFEGCD